jgi:hypothetical protein
MARPEHHACWFDLWTYTFVFIFRIIMAEYGRSIFDLDLIIRLDIPTTVDTNSIPFHVPDFYYLSVSLAGLPHLSQT